MIRYRITVRIKSELLDAESLQIRQSLQQAGFPLLSLKKTTGYEVCVPSGTLITQIEAMCDSFLARPMVDDYTIDMLP